MNRDDISEQDVRNNKVKEGFLIKRSRILKDWKKRWMVLTKTHLYAFEYQGVYKAPAEKIPLKEITTIKSFYKNQYDRPQVFRVESDDTYFYLSAQDHQEKWSWVTAIERMTEMIRNPSMQDSQNLIRESLRMSSAARQSGVNRRSNINQNQSQINSQLFKRLKLKLHPRVADVQLLGKNLNKKAFKLSRLESINFRGEKIVGSGKKLETNQMMEKVVQKIVEVQIEVPVDRIIEKVVEVEKVVYVKDPDRVQHCSLIQLFSALISTNFDDPRPLLDFVAFLALTGIEQFQKAAIDFACQERAQRFFAQLLLQALNEETGEDRLNSYSTLIYVLIERQPDYFYVSDMRILIQIILRELELYRSNLNQMINLRMMRALLSYHLNVLSQKREDIRAIIIEIANLGVPENQDIASQILLLIQ